MITGNAVYQRMLSDTPEEYKDLAISEWSPTPFMVDVFFGLNNSEHEMKITHWLREYGYESSPMHGREGTWKRASVTIHGWSWLGFKTEKDLEHFLKVFPQLEKSQCQTPTI